MVYKTVLTDFDKLLNGTIIKVDCVEDVFSTDKLVIFLVRTIDNKALYTQFRIPQEESNEQKD